MSDIPSTPADGMTLVKIVTAIADTSAPKVATEINAASSVDISCYLTAGGWKPSLSEQVITDERLCTTQTYEQKGRSQRGLDVEYIDNTNTSNAATYNKAKDTLVPGSEHVIGVRRGMPYEAAAATGQKVTLFPVKPGVYSELPGEANSVLKIGQKQFVTGPVSRSVALVAA